MKTDKSGFCICIARIAAAAVMLATAIGIFLGGDAAVNDRLFSGEIAEAARRHHLDPDFVRAVIYRESRFDSFRKGKKGEYGLMQILPGASVRDWARRHHAAEPSGNDLFDVGLNLEIGCWFLAEGVKKYRAYREGMALALVFYNAGPARAEEWKPENVSGEVIPRIKIASTKKYVSEIMARYRRYVKEREKTGK